LGSRERREREREEVRTLILDTARELFVNEGYEAVTMRRIAERIEYSPTAIYFHFRDKESLLKELCQTDFLTLAHQFTAIARIEDPLEQLRRIGQAYVEFGLRNPNHYRLMFMTPHPPFDPDDEMLRKGNPEEDAYAFLRQIIEGGLAAGRLRGTDAELLSQTMWAGVHGVISLQLAKQNDPWINWRSLEERTALMIETLIAGMAKE